MNDPDRLIDLSSRFIEGTLNEQEEAELSRRLDQDGDARKTLARLIHQHGTLHWLLGKTRPEAELPTRSTSRTAAVRSRNRRSSPAAPSSPILWMSAAAVFIVILLGALLSSSGPAPRPPAPIARKPQPRPESSVPVRSADRPSLPMPRAERPPVPGSKPRSERKVGLPVPPPPTAPPVTAPKARPSTEPSRPRKTEAAPARVLALLEQSGEKNEVREGQEIRVGDRQATLIYPDGTRIVLEPGSRVARITEQQRNAGKYLELSQGVLEASVSKQPAGRPLVISTARALARVVGTRFTLEVDARSTRLEVTEGKVRLARPSGITSVLVAAGHFAIAAPGKPLEARPIPVPIARISFGPAGAPVPAGYLADDGSPFDAGRTYGWDIDRAAGTRLRTGTQALHDRRSIIAGSADEEARWEYAVPNGTYRVTVICGGELTSQGPHRIRVEGVPLFRDVFSRRGEHPSRTATVQVRDGRLTMTSGALGTSLRAADGTHDTILNSVSITRIR